jgi:hypothetical protein
MQSDSAVATVPDEMLFQGTVDVLMKGKEPYTQEWGRRYLCVWCNPPCIALFVSEMAAKAQPDYYIWLPPGSEWHEDAGFQGAAPGTSFRLEAQVCVVAHTDSRTGFASSEATRAPHVVASVSAQRPWCALC